jgi:hypothetical protein
MATNQSLTPRSSVLVVGMLDSIHFARWLEQFSEEPIDFHVFPSGPHRAVHPRLKALANSSLLAQYKITWAQMPISLVVWIVDKFFGQRIRGHFIKRLITALQPLIVHALEIQNAGYSVLAAYQSMTPELRPTLVATNYGSDIYWFQRKARHRRKIASLLSLTDVYAAECMRDAHLADCLGFKGRHHEINPNAGGFALSRFDAPLLDDSNRDRIAVKGYHGWAGRGILALRALSKLDEFPTEIKIEVFSANVVTAVYATFLRVARRLDVRVHLKGSLSHDQVLDIFAKSKVYVGVSRTDGISTSMLEAMLQGAIPVQSSTSCCDEWFDESGVIISANNVESVRLAIGQGLALSASEKFRSHNRNVVRIRANETRVRCASINLYRSLTSVASQPGRRDAS